MSTAAPPAGTPAVPAANRAVVEGVVRRVLRRDPPERVVLVRAAPQWPDEPDFDVDGVGVRVVGCPTVLAVLDALSGHLSDNATGAPETYLVVLTPCDDVDLGANVLAHAAGQQVRPVNRWDLVREAFGARHLDPQLTGRRWAWVADALLDAQPPGGWPKVVGSVLDRDTALGRLVAMRLWESGDAARLDPAALLQWTRDEAAVARFVYLGEKERAGMEEWTAATVGPVARVVFRLAAHGHAADAVPFGLATGALLAQTASAKSAASAASVAGSDAGLALARAEERYLGRNPLAAGELRRFAEAAESLVVRWTATDEAETARAVLDRAEEILAELRVAPLADASSVLDAGFDARLGVLGEQIAVALPSIAPADLPAIEAALTALRDHRLWGVRRRDAITAEMAVRLTRWLAAGRSPEPVGSIAGLALAHLRSWSFADRALAAVSGADTSRVPALAGAYDGLGASVRDRRSELDRVFAERLAAWAELSGPADRLLCVEDVLDRVARPLAKRRAPLILVLDGMTAAIGGELAEQILGDWPWLEVGRRDDGREPALATVPSTTTYSRASLLCGELTAGGQDVERAGFAAFWRGRRAVLFHKGRLRERPPDEVRDAIRATGTVVSVVLNTIDDALDHGREGDAAAWRLDGIAYLRDLVAEAWRAGRPVILTADHGHVLHRSDGIRPAQADAARYRGGTPGDGELLVRGPRVLAATPADADGVVAAWDERVRYVPRRAGYHGGIAPAEMVVPVLVFVPSPDLVPAGWAPPYDTGRLVPEWWEAPPSPRHGASAVGRRPAVATKEGLGVRVTGSELMSAQRTFVRKAPPDNEIAAIIDGLADAGGKMPVPAVAAIVGQPAVRMSGYLAQASRLLNVDGYPVLGTSDGGRTVVLNVALLREQFLSTGSPQTW